MQKLTIAVDAMGGDNGPSIVVPAVKRALDNYPHLSISLFGHRDQLEPLLASNQLSQYPRLDVFHCPQEVASDDTPLRALRQLRDSSMRKALDAVKCRQADACVSAGNTGALMASAKVVLKLIPGIERPALVSQLPVKAGKQSLLLDLGANTSCDANVLSQFALMGSALAESLFRIEQPSVALLNIGSEPIKGTNVVKQTADILEQHPQLNYQGFIEGDKLFSGEANVIVCDGFVGNIALKTAEGVASLYLQQVKQTLSGHWWTRLMLKTLLPNLTKQTTRLNPDQYNGASLLGLRGIVVKSHGKADENAFYQAIQQAILEIEQQVPAKIGDKLESILSETK